MSLPGSDGDDGIHLAIDHFLPSLGVVGTVFVTSFRFKELEFTICIGLKVNLREGQIDLLKPSLVLRPWSEWVTHHDQSSHTPLNLILTDMVLVWVIPIEPDAVFVLLDGKGEYVGRFIGEFNINIISPAQVGCMGSVIVEVRDEDCLGGVTVRTGKLVHYLKLKFIARLDLQHRPWKTSAIRAIGRSIRSKLVGHAIHSCIIVIATANSAVGISVTVSDGVIGCSRRNHFNPRLQHSIRA